MKDFINWLKNNEKIGKVIVWLFIITIGLIILNITLESLGLPHYSITTQNLVIVNKVKALEYLINWLTIILSFYSLVLLVFRVEESKNIFKYSILYLITNIIVTVVFKSRFTTIFTIIYVLSFCYFYSNKNKKYILYGIASFVVNTVIQGIWYSIKIKTLDYSSLNELTKMVLYLDYFIIMAMVILVKELYLKKRGGNSGRVLAMDRKIQPRKEISKKNINKSN